jgi:hypothetical protein
MAASQPTAAGARRMSVIQGEKDKQFYAPSFALAKMEAAERMHLGNAVALANPMAMADALKTYKGQPLNKANRYDIRNKAGVQVGIAYFDDRTNPKMPRWVMATPDRVVSLSSVMHDISSGFKRKHDAALREALGRINQPTAAYKGRHPAVSFDDTMSEVRIGTQIFQVGGNLKAILHRLPPGYHDLGQGRTLHRRKDSSSFDVTRDDGDIQTRVGVMHLAIAGSGRTVLYDSFDGVHMGKRADYADYAPYKASEAEIASRALGFDLRHPTTARVHAATVEMPELRRTDGRNEDRLTFTCDAHGGISGVSNGTRRLDSVSAVAAEMGNRIASATIKDKNGAGRQGIVYHAEGRMMFSPARRTAAGQSQLGQPVPLADALRRARAVAPAAPAHVAPLRRPEAAALWMERQGGLDALDADAKKMAREMYDRRCEDDDVYRRKYTLDDYVHYVQTKWAEDNISGSAHAPRKFGREAEVPSYRPPFPRPR